MTASSSDALTARQARIIKQIECCFSDVNLLCDKFLNDKIQEYDGWVITDTMLNVNRLKKITDDAQMICKGLRKSSSGLMEISEQGYKIRRSPSEPLPGDTKKRIEEIIDRTVYAKQFPLDVKLGDLLKFFENYGQLDNVFMEKDLQKKTFKGSVFVTFANKADAAKFVNEEETKFKEQALEVKYFHTDYFKHKAAQEASKGKKETEGKPHKKDEDEIKEEETEAYLEERVTQKMTKNAVLHLKGLNSETSIEQVKAFFSSVLQSDVAWVDIVKGATEGYIRLPGPDSAGSTLENGKIAYNGMVVIQDSEIEVRVVEGDEELQYWKEMFKDIANKKKGGGRGTRQGGRNQRGGRNLTDGRRNRGGPQGKRRHNEKEDSSDGEEHDTEEPPAKVIKSELVIKFQEVLKFKDASYDGEEQDTEEPPAKITKFEMVIIGQQDKRKQSKKDASSDREEQDTEEPPAKVIKSELVIKFQEVLKINNASCGEEEQDTEEPPAKAIKSDMVIKFQEVMKLEDALSDGEEQNTGETPPANVAKTEKVITRPQGRRKQNKRHASCDGEEEDAEEPAAKVIKSEMIITRSQIKRKQNKNHVSKDGEGQDTEEPPCKDVEYEKIMFDAVMTC